MGKSPIRLSQLPMGHKGKIIQITVQGSARRRMLDLGLIVNTCVQALQKSPSGDPTAYFVRGSVIALRAELASEILVQPFFEGGDLSWA